MDTDADSGIDFACVSYTTQQTNDSESKVKRSRQLKWKFT